MGHSQENAAVVDAAVKVERAKLWRRPQLGVHAVSEETLLGVNYDNDGSDSSS